MIIYTAIFIVSGSIRQVTFEAENPEEAKALAEKWGMGVTGQARDNREPSPPEPLAYDVAQAGVILSGNPRKPVSPSTIRRLVSAGKLERLPDTRRLLLTRKSIERYCLKA